MFELGSLFGKTRKSSRDINLLKLAYYKNFWKKAREKHDKMKNIWYNTNINNQKYYGKA